MLPLGITVAFLYGCFFTAPFLRPVSAGGARAPRVCAGYWREFARAVGIAVQRVGASAQSFTAGTHASRLKPCRGYCRPMSGCQHPRFHRWRPCAATQVIPWALQVKGRAPAPKVSLLAPARRDSSHTVGTASQREGAGAQSFAAGTRAPRFMACRGHCCPKSGHQPPKFHCWQPRAAVQVGPWALLSKERAPAPKVSLRAPMRRGSS